MSIIISNEDEFILSAALHQRRKQWDIITGEKSGTLYDYLSVNRFELEDQMFILEKAIDETRKGQKAMEDKKLEAWINENYPDYISYEWDGELLHIFVGRDEPAIILTRDELEDEF